MKAGSGDAERFEEAGGTIKIREFSLARQEERPADGDACEEQDGLGAGATGFQTVTTSSLSDPALSFPQKLLTLSVIAFAPRESR